MACLRHCIRSRRGGSCGGFNCSRASTSSISESPDSTTELPNSHSYPNTRSGSGWRNNVFHTVDLPLPPLSGPLSTQFRLCSSLYRPTITATITISFKEESAMQATLSSRGNKQNKAESGSQGISNKQQGESSKALHGKDKAEDTGKQQMDVAGTVDTPTVQGRGASDEDDDWYQFACRIEE